MVRPGLDKTQDQLTASRAGYDQKREEYNQAQAVLDKAESTAKQTRSDLDRIRQKVSGLEKERHGFLAEINRLDQTVTFDEERVALMKQRRQQVAEEIAALQAERTAAGGEVAGSTRAEEIESPCSAKRAGLLQNARRSLPGSSRNSSHSARSARSFKSGLPAPTPVSATWNVRSSGCGSPRAAWRKTWPAWPAVARL